MANDNWKDIQLSPIQTNGYAPPNDAEPAILTTLALANYTAILTGENNTIGNALVEAYALIIRAGKALSLLRSRSGS